MKFAVHSSQFTVQELASSGICKVLEIVVIFAYFTGGDGIRMSNEIEEESGQQSPPQESQNGKS